MRRNLLRIAASVGLAAVALAIQLAIHPLAAPDSYQVLLGAVALSVMLGGTRSGLLTLGLCGLGKYYLFLLPASEASTHTPNLVARMVLFLALGVIICWMGGRIHRSEEKLASVLASIGEAVVATDERGCVRFMNPVAERLTGWLEREAVKHDFAEVLRLRHADTGQLLGTPMAIPDSTVLESRDGRRVPISGTVDLIRGGGGVVLVFRDITERKRAEQEREELIRQIQAALANVKLLSGLLPICASCKRIRDDRGRWDQIEAYIRSHSEAEFSHGICPDCLQKLYPEYQDEHARG